MKKRNNNKIVIDSKICHGKPVIAGTRIMVWQILDLLESGYTIDQVIEDYFPRITKEDVKACIHYANSLVKGEDIVFPRELTYAISRR